MHRRRIVAITGAALALLLAACGSSAPSAATASAAGSGTASSDAGSSSAASSDGAVDVCGDLPVADVASITGIAVTAGAEDDTPSLGLFGCDYTGSLHQVHVDANTGRSNASVGFDADKKANGAVPAIHVEDVPGIGDKAFTANFSSAWLDVLWDGVLYKVNGADTVTVDQAKQLITELHDKAA